jgi:hypothetical protein
MEVIRILEVLPSKIKVKEVLRLDIPCPIISSNHIIPIIDIPGDYSIDVFFDSSSQGIIEVRMKIYKKWTADLSNASRSIPGAIP